ncbi:MAG: Amino acid transporter substrate binding protein [Pseudomonadota bacterium]|jgi:polar amino acid transport system substrate-binding protein
MHFWRILQLLFVVFIATSCGSKDSPDSKNSLTIATSADNPPYEYIQEGKVIGLDIDIINAIGLELDKKIIIKNLDFPGLLPALTTDSVDAVIAGLTMTDERKQKIDFSIGYVNTSMALLYKKTSNFKSVAELKEKIIGVQTGTTWEAYAKSLISSTDIRIRSLANNLVLVEELKNSSVDAIIMESMQADKFTKNFPELASFQIDETLGEFAIALPKDSALTPIINDAIKKLQEKGELNKIKEKWLIGK